MGKKVGDVLQIAEKIRNRKGYLTFWRFFTENTECFEK